MEVLDSRQQTLKVLEDARALIAPPYAWARGTFSQSSPRAPKGIAFCAMGAIDEAGRGFSLYVVHRAGNELAKCVPDDLVPTDAGARKVTHFNDHQAKGKEDVLKVFDCAIENVKGQGSG